MGTILSCRLCTNNIVDTDPYQNESERRLSGIKKISPVSVIRQYEKSAPLILPVREKPAANMLYQNLFSVRATQNPVTNANVQTILVQPEVVEKTNLIDGVKNEMTSRPIPDGCETSKANKLDDKTMHDVPQDASDSERTEPAKEILKIDDNEGSSSHLDVNAKESIVQMTSSELRLGAGALVENVLAAAMVLTAEALQFDPRDNDINFESTSGKVAVTTGPIPSGISLGYSFSTTSDSSLTKFYKTAIEQVKEKEHQYTRQGASDKMESSGKVQSKVEPPLHPTASEKEPWPCGEMVVGATLFQTDLDADAFKSQANERPPINQESTDICKIINLDREIIDSQEASEKNIHTDSIWEYVDDDEVFKECFDNMHNVSCVKNKYFDENDLESVSSSAIDIHAKCIVTKTLERIVKSYIPVVTASNVND